MKIKTWEFTPEAQKSYFETPTLRIVQYLQRINLVPRVCSFLVTNLLCINL